MSRGPVLALAGDIMIGRGIDQILPDSVSPELYEPHVTDARQYVRLAERVNGGLVLPASYAYPWGDALTDLRELAPDARICNLETALTRDGSPDRSKGIHYRCHPRNVRVLTEAGVDCATLANNHVLDWGPGGLTDTLHSLRNADIACAGAGTTGREAEAAARLSAAGGRLMVFACATEDAGVPASWEAADSHGVHRIGKASEESAARLSSMIEAVKGAGDIVVLSIHWGGNWGYRIPAAHRRFAHSLIDRGSVDLVFGHSSHHPKAIEVYREKLILYGAGDFMNDYEGIGGHEQYRDDLVLLYLPQLDEEGRLKRLRIRPYQLCRFRLQRPSDRDIDWLVSLLARQGERFSTGAVRDSDRGIEIHW